MSAYAAATFSFVCSIIRDWMVIKHTIYEKELFDLIYFCSIAGCLVLNAVTLSKEAPTKKFVLIASIISIFVAIIVGNFFLQKSSIFLTTATFVLIAWIIGGIASRSLLSVGKIFYGRIREGISSLVVGILAIASYDLQSTITIGVSVGTLWTLWVSRNEIKRYFNEKDDGKTKLLFFEILLYSNLSTVIIQLWALYFNSYESKLYGSDPVIVVRISMYIFQFLSIGVVVLVARIPTFLLKIKRFALIYIYGGLGLGLLVSAINPSYGILIMPIIAALSNYAAIVYLRNKE